MRAGPKSWCHAKSTSILRRESTDQVSKVLNRHDDTLSGDNRRLSQAEFLPPKKASTTAGGSHHGVRAVNRADLSGASFVINRDDDHRPAFPLSPAVTLSGPTAREAHERSSDIADTEV